MNAIARALLLVLFALIATQALANDDVVFRVAADDTAVARDEGVWITLEADNRGTRPARLLRWKLPVLASDTPDFVVTRDGEPVAYVGRRVKRALPTAADYLTLAPGERKRFTVDLAQRYAFERDADYTIGFRYRAAEPFAKVRTVEAAPLSLAVQGRPAMRPPVSPLAKVVTGTNAFVGCTVGESNDLPIARNAASDYAANVRTYLSELRNGSRYTTWMGAHDATRYALVGSHFDAIANYIDTRSPLTFNCSCNDDYYAYVYPNDPSLTIYLCNAFWQAPLTGTDSRAGTLIHEASHFDVHGGTDDHAYGQSAAQQLAINSPALAVMNADSHEYLAENTPVREGNTASPPRNVVAQAGNMQAVLSFDAPLTNGGATITNYQYTSNNGATWTTLAPADASSPITITGLANGQAYGFRLRAVNANGNGGASTAVNVTPNVTVDPALIVVTLVRAAPATPRLFDGLPAMAPRNAQWVLTVRNDGATAASGLAISGSVSEALGALGWACRPTAAGCTPGSGSNVLQSTLELAAGASKDIDLNAQVDTARAQARIDVRVAFPGGSVADRQWLEPASSVAMFRGSFE